MSSSSSGSSGSDSSETSDLSGSESLSSSSEFFSAIDESFEVLALNPSAQYSPRLGRHLRDSPEKKRNARLSLDRDKLPPVEVLDLNGGPEVTFIMKNLDTGETFTSDEIWRIPRTKVFDPLRFHLHARSQADTNVALGLIHEDNGHVAGEGGSDVVDNGAAKPDSEVNFGANTVAVKSSHGSVIVPLPLRKLTKLRPTALRKARRHKRERRKSALVNAEAAHGSLDGTSEDIPVEGISSKKKSKKFKGRKTLLKRLHAGRKRSNSASAVQRDSGAAGSTKLHSSADLPVKKKKQLYAQRCLQCCPEAHTGPVWTLAFNFDGTFLATAGQDGPIAIWKVDDAVPGQLLTGMPKGGATAADAADVAAASRNPHRRLVGHARDVLDLAWSHSRSNLLLSASMDGTVRLWRVNMPDTEGQMCAAGVFVHNDIVTSVAFHPWNESCFVTACLDKQVRVWTTSATDAAVRSTPVDGFVTVLAFAATGFAEPVPGHLGSTLICGTYDGRCIWYKVQDGDSAESAKIDPAVGGSISIGGASDASTLKSSSRRTSGKRRKVTGIQVFGAKSGMTVEREYMLVTTSDSRARLVDLHSLQCLRTYRGLVNAHFQIGARFSEAGQFLLCGSEDGSLLLWNAALPSREYEGDQGSKLNKHEKVPVLDQICASPTTVSCAAFAPFERRANTQKRVEGQILVTADVKGEIKVWENTPI